jgi:hypothetical protein
MQPCARSCLRLLFWLLAAAAVACGGAPAEDGGAGNAGPATIDSTDPMHDGGAASPRLACDGPPATLSLGTYPKDAVNWVGLTAAYALRGTVRAIRQWPAACNDRQSAYVADTFEVEEVVWARGRLIQPGASMEIDDEGFTVGQKLLVLGASGTFVGAPAGCTGVYDAKYLDLARYPKAATDMIKLRAFLEDRADYEQMIGSRRVVDAVLAAAGPQVQAPTAPFPYVDLTLEILQTLCGPTTAPLTARYRVADPSPPAVGARLVVLLGTSTNDPGIAPAAYDVVTTFPPNLAPRLSALLASPPILSL